MLLGTSIYTFNKMVSGAMGRGSWWSGRGSDAADRAGMKLVEIEAAHICYPHLINFVIPLMALFAYGLILLPCRYA